MLFQFAQSSRTARSEGCAIGSTALSWNAGPHRAAAGRRSEAKQRITDALLERFTAGNEVKDVATLVVALSAALPVMQ
jgi:hypothetical protein